MTASAESPVLTTPTGDLPLADYEAHVGDHALKIWSALPMLNYDHESRFLNDPPESRLPYGVVLWRAAFALANEIAGRDVAAKRVLELGCGVGLVGLAAAKLGAVVVQTDRDELALRLAKMNAERNGLTDIEQRVADWTDWHETDQYDFIVGSDVLYSEPLHPHVRRIFETNLAPGGVILASDPFRSASARFVKSMTADGWSGTLFRRFAGEPRQLLGVYELTR